MLAFHHIAHPQMRHPRGGGPSGRGQHAPARNRFKGVMGVQRDLRGEIRNPPVVPLAPPEAPAPQRASPAGGTSAYPPLPSNRSP